MKEVTLPDTLTSIGKNAFVNCGSLENITIPKSVSTIEEGAFGYDVVEDTLQKNDVITITGYTVSEAHNYADANDIPFIPLDTPVTTDTTTTPPVATETTQTSETTEVPPIGSDETTASTDTSTSGSDETTASTDSTSETTSTEPIPFTVLYGDVNLDGRVGLDDAVMLNKAVAGSVVLNENAKSNAECNAAPGIDAADSMSLLKFLVHIIDNLPEAAE